MANLIGTQVDRYQIQELIGEGGMAVVYRALNTRLDSTVAVKVIRTERLAPEIAEKALKRFEREAKSLAQLTHPNIVGVIDYGDHHGQPYLVMEYLGGGSVKKFLGKPMPWQEAVRLLLPIAHALEFAHKRHIIHRDVKPSNILLTESGQPMLADFGIAKIVEEDMTVDLTGTRGTIGTPEYMSPEQGLGKNVDARTDIYALGVALYELITGRKPFLGDTPMETLFKHVNEPLPRPTKFIPNLPVSVETILLRSLAKKADDRFASMSLFAEDMEQALHGTTKQTKVPVPPKSRPEPKQPKRDIVKEIQQHLSNARKFVSAYSKTVIDKLGTKHPVSGDISLSRKPIIFGIAGLVLAVGSVIFILVPLFGGPSPVLFSYPPGIYYTSNSSGQTQIYYFANGATQPIIGSNGQGNNWFPTPDGRGSLYFMSDRNGHAEILAMDSKGKIIQVFKTSGEGKNWSPAPDGRGNLYFTSDRNGESEVFVLDTKGKVSRVISANGQGESWSPAPDGWGNLYFVSNRSGKAEIYMLDTKGKITQVIHTKEKGESWLPAPDGRGNLYFTSNKSGKVEVFVLDTKGKVSQVTHTNGKAESWGPVANITGNLCFTSDRDGIATVFCMNANGITSPITDTSDTRWTKLLSGQPPTSNNFK